MHPLFNPVAPYRYLLPTVYLFMADIANSDLFVCSCWTWICLNITRFYEEQRQPSSDPHGRLLSPKTLIIRHPLMGTGGFDTICTAVCNLRDSFTACRTCRLEHVTTASSAVSKALPQAPGKWNCFFLHASL